MKRITILSTVAVILLSACASIEGNRMIEGTSFFYGFIKPGFGQNLSEIEIRNFENEGPFGGRIGVVYNPDGFFYATNIKPGKYYVFRAVMRGWLGGGTQYFFGQPLSFKGFEESSFVLDPGKLTFVFSVAFEDTGVPLFPIGETRIYRYEQMRARACLEKIQTLIKNEDWKARIAEELSK